MYGHFAILTRGFYNRNIGDYSVGWEHGYLAPLKRCLSHISEQVWLFQKHLYICSFQNQNNSLTAKNL
jgi:hypothetical protein